ncbi:hypothetical protein Aperf_G00000077689 [Anoplocephala perfoliata]
MNLYETREDYINLNNCQCVVACSAFCKSVNHFVTVLLRPSATWPLERMVDTAVTNVSLRLLLSWVLVGFVKTERNPMFKRVTFGSVKPKNASSTKEAVLDYPSRTNVGEFPSGTVIPPEILEKRILELKNEQSFEALRLKVQKADEERRQKEEMERLIAEKQGRLQDHGKDEQLGYLCFKLFYDVNREALKVTLLEANHLRSRDPLGILVNVRVQIILKSTRDPNKIIRPRAELNMLNKLSDNRSWEYAQNSAQRMAGKTKTVDPSSSSIFWRTHKPVWNEDFFFKNEAEILKIMLSRESSWFSDAFLDLDRKGLQNRTLKNLILVFTLFERTPVLQSDQMREDFLGEVKIPLKKLHKKLTSANSTKTLQVREPNQNPSSAPQKETSIRLENKEIPPPPIEEPKPQIELPKEKPLPEKESVTRWLAGTTSPTPGKDEEFEELESICNSEAVHDLLRDPDLMDSVSVRELRIANSEVKTHLDTIKELTVPVKPEPEIVEPEEEMVEMNDCDDSEEELPADERPFVIRSLEGWHYINRVPELRPCYGSLEIGLFHDPNLGKITISIIKGKKITAPDNSLMEISVSVQKKTRMYKKSSPLQAIPSVRGGSKTRSGYTNNNKNEPVAITEKPGKIHRTSVRCNTSEPVWDDRFTFNVPKEQLLNVSFDILVYHKESVIGGLRMGHAASYRASQHWAKMIKRPAVWAFCSYLLQ